MHRIGALALAFDSAMVGGVNTLVECGLPTVLVSNAWCSAETYPWAQLPKFTDALVPCEVRLGKLHPEIEELAAARRSACSAMTWRQTLFSPGRWACGLSFSDQQREPSRSWDGSMGDAEDRQALITACEQVLTRTGHWDFKVRNVCRQARISTHVFYRHFSGKDELIIAILERGVAEVAEQLRAEIAIGATPTERVWNLVRAELDRAAKQGSRAAPLMDNLNWRAVMTRRADVYERCVAMLAAPLADVLNEAHVKGELYCLDPYADARAILFLIRGSALDRPRLPGEDVREELERAVVPLISRALGLRSDAGV